MTASVSGFASALAALGEAGTPIRVGRLEKLLESKAASGRAKDIAFLTAFDSARSGDEDETA